MTTAANELPNDPDELPAAELYRMAFRILAEQQRQRREQARTDAAITLLANAIRELNSTLSDTPGVREQRWRDAINRARFEPPYVKKD
jgi:hypothetical protein